MGGYESVITNSLTVNSKLHGPHTLKQQVKRGEVFQPRKLLKGVKIFDGIYLDKRTEEVEKN